MGKISALWDALRKGQEVGNADVLKNGAAAGSSIAGLILALWTLAKAFGADLPDITESQALLWGTGIASAAAFINGWVHLATSKRVGLLPAKDATDQNARDAGLGS